jgi:tRNA dimethylallyltransferase
MRNPLKKESILKDAPHNLPILVAGPTGSGKTSFAVALANRVGGEIVCADAFQVYQGMSVLTAQPRAEEQNGVVHHLFGCINPSQPFDVADWLGRVTSIVQQVTERGLTPILVGGTGLYLKAFTHGLDPSPPSDPALRTELEKLPLAGLCARLAEADPSAMDAVDLKNPRRVQRALEVVLLSGKPLASFRSAWSKPSRPLASAVWLHRERQDLHQRIAANVIRTLSSGAVEEVKSLREKIKGLPAGRAIGFKEISSWLDGHCDFDECRDRMITASRQYARRQETWFRRQKEILPVSLPRNI